MLAGNGLVKQLRTINLRSNCAMYLAVKALLVAYYPQGYGDDDEYIFDSEVAALDLRHDCELMTLDLADNK